MSIIVKSVAAIEDHVVDYDPVLAEDESLLDGSVLLAVEPQESAGLAVMQYEILGRALKIRLSAGLIGRRYQVQVRCATSAGRVIARQMIVRIGEESLA